MSQEQAHATESRIQELESAEEFVRQAADNNELVMDVDGFYKWWPTHSVVGEALTAEKLRAIAAWLDKHNKTLGAMVCQSVMANQA